VIQALISDAVAAGARKTAACALIGMPVRTLQDWVRSIGDQRAVRSKPPANALSADEVTHMMEVLNSVEFRNLPPAQIVPRLAERGDYIASESTMYRELRERRLLAHRSTARPPTARAPKRRDTTGPNQVWSWDITWLRRRDEPGRYYYLYLFVDVWSRYIVGWSIEEAESDVLAATLLQRIATKLGIDPTGIVLHSDNGHPMRGASMIATMYALGVVASLSRPRVSNDNPFSESLNKTLKYRPGYPSAGFADLAAARAWVASFETWYNDEHRHSEIRFVTPRQRFVGDEHQVLAKRAATLETARAAHPERWTGRKIRNCTPIAVVTMHPDVRAYATTSAA
jgi:putative transposase